MSMLKRMKAATVKPESPARIDLNTRWPAWHTGMFDKPAKY
jgi:hypothetical protein